MFRNIVNSLLWGNSVALAWMWGLGLFFSVQMTYMFGLQGLMLFAIPNALGLVIFGCLTQIVAKRQAGGQESLARFFEKFSKPFRLIFFLYQLLAITLTVFALSKYLFSSLDLVSAKMVPLYLSMVVFVVLAAGCLSGEEFGIQNIKLGHAVMGGLLLLCVGTIIFLLEPSLGKGIAGWLPDYPDAWKGPDLNAHVVPLLVGLLVGPWLDLQHWQRAIQIHRENTSIRLSYAFGGLLFFLLLLFHGALAAWVLGRSGGVVPGAFNDLDHFRYAHDLIVNHVASIDGGRNWLAAAYFGFLGVCALTTLDSGYIALKWFLGENLAKSQNVLLAMLPKRILESPIPSFLLIALVTLVSLWIGFELEYFMVFYASFFVGYAGLAIARSFVPNAQHPLPQIRMFSTASIALVIFAFGYHTGSHLLMLIGSLLPLIYVGWLVIRADLLRVVHERAGEVLEAAAAEIPAIKAISNVGKAAMASEVVAPQPADAHSLGGHFEGKWFVYSFLATYQDTNSVGNVYFGMYALFVGKTRELFFNKAMPDFDLKTTDFYILTRSFEHKFVREAREFDTITVKIRVADFSRKFCTLEHQIFGSNNELLGKGKQNLLFVSSKDYSLLDIPGKVYSAFIPYV